MSGILYLVPEDVAAVRLAMKATSRDRCVESDCVERDRLGHVERVEAENQLQYSVIRISQTSGLGQEE